ncbi:hypothetical protein RHSIM_Rhsim13G0098300 [Rhododendron simsii]|uniref:MORF/ORRM1/DAG-like MORF domain-containing protein n=1 Tax=Rhododendron simsii TaxID=118357 RepID=A0A834L797_RHOSS|nr:hypothetical protein RHSIM_Rhsim13G0098300 [Rhododendron simsii]
MGSNLTRTSSNEGGLSSQSSRGTLSRVARAKRERENRERKIHSVCTTTYTGFSALISEELFHNFKGLPGILWVLPDPYLDVPNKDYGGLFVNGHTKTTRRLNGEKYHSNKIREEYEGIFSDDDT